MQDQRIALRYADALLDLSEAQHVSEAVQKDMELILTTLDENPDLLSALRNPVISSEKKATVLKSIFESSCSELSNSMTKGLCENGREALLDLVAQNYIQLYKASKNIQEVVLTTASDIDDSFRTKVIELVKQTHSGEIKLTEHIDPSIIGGFILQIGDKRINNSVSNQLSALKREFESNLDTKA